VEAILVAGGKGKRLGDAARGRPKALVEVAGRPLASYMVERLTAAGVSRVVANCSRGTAGLFLEALAGLGCEVVAAEEPEPLGRGGGVKFASRFLSESAPFLVVYGDELIDVDFQALLDHHQRQGASLTVTAAPLSTPFGVLEMNEDGQVADFREGAEIDDHWVNVGVYAMDPALLARLPEQGDAEHDLFPTLAAEGKLWAYRHTGVWLTVNTPKDLERLEAFFGQHPDWPDHLALRRDISHSLDKVRRDKDERVERALARPLPSLFQPGVPFS
jgi:NDP-sugar pyrophosphorylase family protein